jgi:hypothetical protein
MITCISCGNPIGEKSTSFCDQCFNEPPITASPAVLTAAQTVAKGDLSEMQDMPLPLRVSDSGIDDANGWMVAVVPIKSKAELIVRAVNCHDLLIEALRDVCEHKFCECGDLNSCSACRAIALLSTISPTTSK